MPKSPTTTGKNYLRYRILPATILFWILFGFVFGSQLGNLFLAQRDKDSILLTMTYSSEKNAWIEQTSSKFLDYWAARQAKDPSLKDIILDFQPYGSGDSLISLLNGEIKPVIWSPASSLWIPLLNAQWIDYTKKDVPLVSNSTRLIYSPVVIATWENFYQEHPFNGINDLHDLIVQNPGLVNLAHTDPSGSNSGFMATIMMVSAYLSMNPENITLADIYQDSLAQWLTEIESAAIFYGKSTGFLSQYMLTQGPEDLQVAFLYENLIQDAANTSLQKWGQKLIAVYPEEGSLYSDHPFCILDANWISDDQRMAAEAYLDFLSQPQIIQDAIEVGFRPINSTILQDPAINATYLSSFNWNYGVTPNPADITEAFPPTDGTVIARIPDLWLKTRNRA